MELRRAYSSIHPRVRIHGRPCERRRHSIRQRRSCPVVARKLASASPRQARQTARGWPIQALLVANNRARAMAGQPLAI